MERLVYIAGDECQNGTGVAKKIRNEIKAFQNAGFETTLVFVNELPKWKKILPFSASFDWKHLDLPEKFEYLYIRWEPVSFPFIRFLRKCCKNNPRLKVVMEIGTYPYLEELN